MRKITFIFCILFAQIVSAQTHVGFSLQMGVPMNEFKQNTRAIGAGVNLNLYKPIAPRVPVFVGFNLGYMLYGSYTQDINENLGLYDSGGNLISTIPVAFDVTTNNNMLNGNIALRFKIPFASVQPYIEGIGGFNYLYTRTSIYDDTPNRRFINDPNQESRLINARTQVQSFVLQYGAGGGFLIKIGENTNLDIRGLYTIGGRASYFDRSQSSQWRIDFAGSAANYNDNSNLNLNTSGVPKKSNTDLFLINFGLSFNL
jgi:hypothetical protein